MATEYKFGGSKREGEVVTRLIISATDDTERREVALGEKVELSDEEHNELKGSYKLTKAGEPDSEEPQGGTSQPETREQQQQAQTAGSGAQHGTAGEEAGSAKPPSTGRKN